ncbi:MAG: replicative DNA helicase [Actinomycetota bacterium]|nr:replicative DNA helicase [Thermoleophilia bacterium]MDA3005804.1 replicative DNA helicase [Actinomycetota bacterium]
MSSEAGAVARREAAPPATVGGGHIPPPQNQEAEQLLLASLIDGPQNNIAEAMALVGLDDFYREGHRRIFNAITELFAVGEPIEPITIIEQLTKTGDLDMAGGRDAVLDLMTTPYIAASYRSYAEIVRDTATQRRLLQVGQEIEVLVAEREGETTDMVQRAEDLIYDLTQKRTRGDFVGTDTLVMSSMERLVAASEHGSEVTGLPTGFEDLDRLTGGFRAANLVVVAARPSMGKTALALCMAEHVALAEQKAVAIFSLEMSGEELTQRMLCSVAMVDASRMRSGRLSADDWPRVSQAADRLSKAPIFIDDSEGMTVTEMRTKARRLKARHGLGLIVVDYIQLMEGAPNLRRRDENRVQELSAISRGLKMMARDLEVPIIVVSQLNRSPDARTDKRPMLSDLRESGAIEQDADMVLLIYRDDYYEPDSESKGIAEVNVAKHRNGPTDRVKLAFMGTYAKFASLASDHDTR